MPETKPAAATVEPISSNNGTTSDKPDNIAPASDNTTPAVEKSVPTSKGWRKS